MAKKILIAEDEKPLARALSLKLAKEGIEADIASDGDQVREKTEANAYDLVLTDLMMPKHDGFALIEAMKAKKTPVIVMSNLSQDTDRNRAASAGALHYFVKSDTPLSEMVALIKKTLG